MNILQGTSSTYALRCISTGGLAMDTAHSSHDCSGIGFYNTSFQSSSLLLVLLGQAYTGTISRQRTATQNAHREIRIKQNSVSGLQ